MKYTILLLFCLVTNFLIAQDYGQLLHEYKFGTYDINYHSSYRGKKIETNMYMDNGRGGRRLLGPRFHTVKVKVYEKNVTVDCFGRYGQFEGMHVIQDITEGDGIVSYTLTEGRKMVVHANRISMFSNPKSSGGSTVYLMEEIYRDPK